MRAPANDFSHIYNPQIRALLNETAAENNAAQNTVESAMENATETAPQYALEPDPAPPLAPDAPCFADAARAVALYHADALELLPRFPAESFDVIFADPPYFLSGDGVTCQNGRMVSVNKGDWDTATSFAAMHAFNLRWIALCQRLLKPNGTIWITGTNHNIYSVGAALQTLDFKILNDIAWYKVNPPPNLACRYFTHATETILWARKSPGARHYFDYAAMKAENGNKQMQSLWSITPPAAREKRHGKHPTQKPEALLRRIVLSSTRPGDAVLDPFCGSATTGVVCARLGRAFVGVEKEAAYLAPAAARMSDELQTAPPLTLAAPLPVPLPLPDKTAAPRRAWTKHVADALRELGGEGHLSDINTVIAAAPDFGRTPTWTCTVRRVVRQSPLFLPVGRGRYRLLDQMALWL